MYLVIPDTHFKENLGYADYIYDRRIPEKQEILDFIVEQSYDCDKVIFMGDVFNKRNNPSVVIKEVVRFIKRFDGKQIYILAGNHDKVGSGRSSIDFLKEMKNKDWHVITDKIQNINKITYCPYFSRAELNAKDNIVATKKIMKQLHGGDILFVHHAISDTLINEKQTTDIFNEPVLPKKELEKRYKLVIGGHIHKPQASGKTIVTGSIFNNEVGEAQKYIWKVDESNLSVQQIKLPGRGILGLENPNIEDLDKIDKHNIVKVVFTNKEKKKEVEELKEKLEKFDAYLFLEQYPRQRKKIHFEEGMLDMPIEKLLECYAKERKVSLKKLQEAFELIK